MKLVLRPPGRGNWAPLLVTIEGRSAAPLLVRRGDRLPLGGVVYWIARVLP